MDVWGNIVTEDEEKAEVLNTCFDLVLTQPTKLEDRDREQTEAPLIQGELVSDLLHYLYTHKFVGADVIHPRVVSELVKALTEALSNIYQQV